MFSIAKGNIPIVKKIAKNRNHEIHKLSTEYVHAVFQAHLDIFVRQG